MSDDTGAEAVARTCRWIIESGHWLCQTHESRGASHCDAAFREREQEIARLKDELSEKHAEVLRLTGAELRARQQLAEARVLLNRWAGWQNEVRAFLAPAVEGPQTHAFVRPAFESQGCLATVTTVAGRVRCMAPASDPCHAPTAQPEETPDFGKMRRDLLEKLNGVEADANLPPPAPTPERAPAVCHNCVAIRGEQDDLSALCIHHAAPDPVAAPAMAWITCGGCGEAVGLGHICPPVCVIDGRWCATHSRFTLTETSRDCAPPAQPKPTEEG